MIWETRSNNRQRAEAFEIDSHGGAAHCQDRKRNIRRNKKKKQVEKKVTEKQRKRIEKYRHIKRTVTDKPETINYYYNCNRPQDNRWPPEDCLKQITKLP